jgi:hypothetical protein
MRMLAPGGEWLFDTMPSEHIDIELDLERFRIPALVAATFRKDAYVRVGGFRRIFVVAQDADLWLRLVEAGPCRGIPRLHYQTALAANGISGRRRQEQQRLSQLAIDCAKRRRAGEDDAPLLAAFTLHPPGQAGPRTGNRADFHYFVASCLRRHNPEAARRYYELALRDNPFHFKALIRRVLT